MTERAEVLAGVTDADLAGRTILVTGSTDGIGRETALALGRLGATVIVHGRDGEKGRAVVERIVEAGGDAALVVADFVDFDAVRYLAETVAEYGSLDVLVNNAGGYVRRSRLTADGFEYAFCVNHLAPFLLTALVADKLGSGARVVTTASEAHRGVGGLDAESVRSVEDYRAWRAYSRSKLANVLFTAALARRLDDATATCFHPGFVPGSGFLREVPAPVRTGLRALQYLPDVISNRLVASVVEGAATAVSLAVAGGGADANGRYFAGRAPVRSVTPSSTARDLDLQEWLWDRSLEWTGLVDDAGRSESTSSWP